MGVIIIGGGIVGLATALQLTRRCQGLPVTVIEKEEVAAHQTGHNSGVVHAGVYYAPGSLKAEFCRAGVQATLKFCRRHGLPYEQRGKLIVATNDLELERLGALFARCVKNGLDPERLDGRQLSEREPRITGKGAILVQSSGITDYPAIARTMVKEIRRRGGIVLCGVEVVGIKERPTEVTVETTEGEFKTEFVTSNGHRVLKGYTLLGCRGIYSW
jgi:L-2-hydroxyglutarate oxidase